MDLQCGHWPHGTKRKAECVVCSKKRAKLHLQQSDCRYESGSKIAKVFMQFSQILSNRKTFLPLNFCCLWYTVYSIALCSPFLFL